MEFHALVLNDDIENRGKFKKSNNEILGAGFETTPYYLVEEKLTELIDEFNSNENYDLIMKVACFHADFEKIHPLIDGNGRDWEVTSEFGAYEKWVSNYSYTK